ncbi:MAG: hypothetical protein KGL58_00140, partial [Pseudomonadota bacterium]|nr:hypothetical protein [Pseudomonadota bacterium]
MNQNRLATLPLCLAIGWLGCSSAWADTNKNEVFQGGEIVVSSQRSVIEQTSTVRTVTASQIRR